MRGHEVRERRRQPAVHVARATERREVRRERVIPRDRAQEVLHRGEEQERQALVRRGGEERLGEPGIVGDRRGEVLVPGREPAKLRPREMPERPGQQARLRRSHAGIVPARHRRRSDAGHRHLARFAKVA
jgi:hypothetical protein